MLKIWPLGESPGNEGLTLWASLLSVIVVLHCLLYNALNQLLFILSGEIIDFGGRASVVPGTPSWLDIDVYLIVRHSVYIL